MDVFLLTAENIGIMFFFIAAGYLLRRCRLLPDNSAKVISSLISMVFFPCYTFSNLSSNVTPEYLTTKLPLVLLGIPVLLGALGLAYGLGILYKKPPVPKRQLIYILTFANYGYFGYPLVKAVFGEQMLADFIIFALPYSLVIFTFGYWLLTGEGKSPWKSLCKPMPIALFLGLIVGLAGLKMPSVISGIVSKGGACMSPLSMVLTGFVLGSFDLRNLFGSIHSYILTLLRMVLIPAVIGAVCYLVGLRGEWLILPILISAMPAGMNTVVFAESCGRDSSGAARIAFVSTVAALAILPLTFTAVSLLP